MLRFLIRALRNFRASCSSSAGVPPCIHRLMGLRELLFALELVNEYSWITITSGYLLPTVEELSNGFVGSDEEWLVPIRMRPDSFIPRGSLFEYVSRRISRQPCSVNPWFNAYAAA